MTSVPSVTNPHRPFPAEVQLAAFELAKRSLSLRKIEYHLKQRYDDAPAYNTIQAWVQEWIESNDLEQLRSEQIKRNSQDLVLWADDLSFQRMAYLDGKPKEIKLQEVALVAGLNRDKLAAQQGTTVNIAVQVFNQAREIEQRTVETTATVVDTSA